MKSRFRLASGVLGLALFAIAQPGVVRFRTVSILDDPRRIGGEAYRLLAPADWRADNNVIWHNSASNTANPWVKLVGPARQEIGVLPPIAFIWNDRLMSANYRPGSYYGSSEVQFPVLDPFQCIEKIVIPRYRRHLDNATVVKQELLPELAAAARAKYPQSEFPKSSLQAGKVRFEYVENGVPMQEDVYILTVAVQVTSGQVVSTLWAPDEIRYSKAPKGTLDAQLPLFETSVFSLRPNLKWFGHLQDISQEYGRLQAQAGSAAAARALSQGAVFADRMDAPNRTTEEINQRNALSLKRYQNRQAILDSINARWERAAAPVEVYRNPTTGEYVRLPAGYNSAWVNQNGEYQVAGDLKYDPSATAGGPWTKLEKAP